MTCIVGISNGDYSVMMGDRFQGGSGIKDIDAHTKLFEQDGFIMGCSGSYRESRDRDWETYPPSLLNNRHY